MNVEKSKNKDLIPKLPEPCFQVLKDYDISNAPPKPLSYIRFIEKSVEDLDGEVEYDLDEEDAAWLEIINEKRLEQGLEGVSVQQTNAKGETNAVIDDDAICCICMDGDCQNSNVILFCDMCNLAVHQDCYGVPYIPEGQWLCRRCLHSPSRTVDCVLCPNSGGAFKQTDRGHWAHTVFLEPIDSIETIPSARWRLICYLCKQKGVGACIQCHKTNCYSAFHVTCAQHAGLYMKMDTVDDVANPDAVDLVEKIAYCEAHTPPDVGETPKLSKALVLPRNRAESVTFSHTISVPTIPPDKIQEIGDLLSVTKKNQFIQRLIAYWTLKRQLRNGVPLLRSLQATHISRKEGGSRMTQKITDVKQLEQQFKYWYRFRQDLEKARLLCELVRKRERLKRDLIKLKAQSLEIELCPMASVFRHLIDTLRSYDTGEIFIEPVDQVEVPDYGGVIKNPMDLSTMRKKVDSFHYESLSDFEADFCLMINNCLTYNSKDTVFYKAAVKMRDKGDVLFDQVKKELEKLSRQADKNF
ncbi:hypothetical protein AAG570_000334 [Ranatra chinensis]|uniref:Bromodomain and PHD finger-containing protein n=1 Tax=Ranatra chinensis TaxID=642074 RepID=A0ABD0YWT5_9HEMI